MEASSAKSAGPGDNSGVVFVLISAAHNEQASITRTLASVLAPPRRPSRWVIVDDGSTDQTGLIVKAYAQQYPWIVLHNARRPHERSFASKARAINAAYLSLRDELFDVLGVVDADVSFEPDFCEFLMQRFDQDSGLGVSGTPFFEAHHAAPDYDMVESGHVPGQCQFFRRECFEAIGCYQPMPEGGIDTVAVMTAKMLGWQTQVWPEKEFEHHRPLGTYNHGRLGAAYHMGRKDYFLGGHPIWQLARALFQMRNPPYLLGGSLLLAGYFVALLKREPIPVSRAFMAYRRKEQFRRLRAALRIGGGKGAIYLG